MHDRYPHLVAHRGYAYRYPENTLLAIQAAVEVGAMYVEFDVLLSADRVPVLFHDRDCMRMCGKPGAIHEYRIAELETFAVSEPEKFATRFEDNRITRLQALVNYIKTTPQVTVFVELKRQALQEHGISAVLSEVLPMLEVIKSQVVIISYSIESLLETRRQSSFAVAAVFDSWQERDDPLIKELQPEYMFTDIHDLPKEGELSCSGIKLAVYECADPEWALSVHQRGVDMIETFQISEMLASFYPR